MKTKLRIQNRLNFILIEALFLSFILEILFNFSYLDLLDFFLINSIISVGVSLLIKGILFKSDNSIWFGIILIFYGFFSYFSSYGIIIPIWLYTASAIFPSLIVGLIFNENFSYRLAFMLFIISILIYYFEKINFISFIIMFVLLMVGGFLLQQQIFSNKKG